MFIIKEEKFKVDISTNWIYNENILIIGVIIYSNNFFHEIF